ncbi:MAG: hypothetical protein GKR97_02110 [Rhizobiaceae bacterium]|nr:hypothetical protein [Rhizobiaceae bacterium]
MRNAQPRQLLRFISTIAATGLGVFMATGAAASQSDWFVTEGAKIRLISLPSADGKTIDAGLQIDLDKGWKTYWRSPGASGLPPQLDFSQSSNIASTKLDYPTPMTFGSNENLTVGYNIPVTFPISIEPLFGDRPVNIKVAGIIGICAEVCIPVQFTLSLVEEGNGQSTRDVAAALFQARANLVGQQRPDFQVIAATVSNRVLQIDATVPAGTQHSTALVEGPSTWYLTPAKATTINGSNARYEVSLKDIPSDAAPEETELTVTLVSDGIGVETVLVPTRK